jgi:aminoglycoside 6'-N-acetyltransferase
VSEPFFVAGDFSFRPIDDGDVARIMRWLADPEVGGWWEGTTVTYDEEYVRREFLDQVGEEYVTKAIVELDGHPIGFQQWYSLDGTGEQDVREEYGIESPGAFGIDQFIGESALHNRGIGTRQVRAVAEWLVAADGPGAQCVVTDPIVENLRAVRCYEKAGFRKLRILPVHEALDGVKRDSWLMGLQPVAGGR